MKATVLSFAVLQRVWSTALVAIGAVTFAGMAHAATPDVGISVDGHNSGDTITRPYGGSTSITVRYTASDSDGTLQGIRYNIWNSTTGYFDNGGGGFIDVGGSGGEVDRTVNLDSNGDWYFWTDAQDYDGSYNSTGAWQSGFHIVVSQAAPPNSPPSSSLSVSSTSITLGQGVMLTSTITDPDNNLSNQAVDISTDNSNWTSGWNNWSGQTAWNVSGGSATDTVNYTPPSAGTYYFRSRGQDTTGALSNFAFVTVTVTAPNHQPQVNWASGNNTSPGSTTTLSGNVTDQDGNLQTAYFYINPPNRSGWQFVGTVGISGGNATPALNYTFPTNAAAGSWMVTMRVVDTNGTWDPDTNDIGYFNVDTTPTSQLTVSPSSGFTAGQAITLTSTITDPDGNLSNQAVDISTDNVNWTSGWNNWSGQTAWNISGSSAMNAVTYTLPSPGTYYFRSRGQDSMGALSNFIYVTITAGSSTYSLTVQNGSGSASGLTSGSVVSIAANAAPAGYAFSSWSVSGPGSFANASASSTTFTMGAGNATVTANYRPLPPTITSGSAASGTLNVAFGGYQITATNNPTSYSASGLPAGLAVNPSSGVISGTPTVAGTFSVGLTASNAGGTGTGALTLTIAFGPGDLTTNSYQYDKTNQLKQGPGGKYSPDAEGNIGSVTQ